MNQLVVCYVSSVSPYHLFCLVAFAAASRLLCLLRLLCLFSRPAGFRFFSSFPNVLLLACLSLPSLLSFSCRFWFLFSLGFFESFLSLVLLSSSLFLPSLDSLASHLPLAFFDFRLRLAFFPDHLLLVLFSRLLLAFSASILPLASFAWHRLLAFLFLFGFCLSFNLFGSLLSFHLRLKSLAFFPSLVSLALFPSHVVLDFSLSNMFLFFFPPFLLLFSSASFLPLSSLVHLVLLACLFLSFALVALVIIVSPPSNNRWCFQQCELPCQRNYLTI